MAIKLSIIVPVYNVEEYIRPCVESIFKQGLDESTYEVILVNDGTKDNSFGVIEDIVNSHSNILIVEQKNQGLSAARNTGMTIMTHEISCTVFVLNDDDEVASSDSVLESEYLGAHLRLFPTVQKPN